MNQNTHNPPIPSKPGRYPTKHGIPEHGKTLSPSEKIAKPVNQHPKAAHANRPFTQTREILTNIYKIATVTAETATASQRPGQQTTHKRQFAGKKSD